MKKAKSIITVIRARQPHINTLELVITTSGERGDARYQVYEVHGHESGYKTTLIHEAGYDSEINAVRAFDRIGKE